MDKDLDSITLTQTCAACPEQYDAYHNGAIVGYLRLRHGHFRVTYHGVDNLEMYGETVYEVPTVGDGLFDSEERADHLANAKRALFDRIFRSRVN